ncbi:hypothetical protein DFH08DRAFT_819757 [Mycena albidolilacea]|uniref:Uncharacterized protein n=1 Tax=Mycena albidolilacea TaxID=1033008 RepID=A0AAD7EEK9_9AGAR|nr:hypothetical protein DFH08DRAFT_819757 [Mycena albidolilacea]
MDATTVLGSKCVQLDLAVPGAQAVGPTYIFGCEVEMLVNEGECKKTLNKLQAPKRVGNGGAPHAKWALRGCKKAPKRAVQAQYQATPYAPWASQRIGAEWEQPRACEKGPVGRKKPKNGLRKRSTRQHHMPPGQARG